MTCPETIAIGAYVLGSLDADERLETDQHIRDCAQCRETLLQFAHLPGLLHTLTLEEIMSPVLVFDPSPDYRPELDWLTAGIPPDRREPLPVSPAAVEVPGSSPPTPRRFPRRRVLIAAAAAAIVVLAGGLIGRQLVTDSTPQAQNSITWSATDGVGGIDTAAQMTSRSWGTDIRLRMKDLQSGAVCMLVVHARNGASETTGWWAAKDAPEADVPASTSIPLADIDRVQVVTADKRVLSTLTESTR
jgi:hypothetical protein